MATAKFKSIKAKKPRAEARGGPGAPKQKQSTGGKAKKGKR